ncbi:hypothetical protein [Urbifossiella limnaea]|uniref:Uncharacterized protein n=1 Tax=Urbifossiella limnaea TaxID=2528023 RepID=A0A517XP27_9BACT|nr:hypothetical protein [Urbifossiella limnaea]QDU19259.1 hypothetical protein ETAA1_11650 [Urbifossiella limnaea]
MTCEGTVVNGTIVFDNPPPFPEGTRVRVESADDADLWDELARVPAPPETETREEFLASLRQSVADVRAGAKGKPLAEFAAELKREFGTPSERPEGS